MDDLLKPLEKDPSLVSPQPESTEPDDCGWVCA